MSGPAGVMALMLAVTMTGGIVLLFCTPLWGEVKRGFFILTGSVIAVVALCAVGSMFAGGANGSPSGQWALWLTEATLALTVVWLLLLVTRHPPSSRAIGLLTVPVSVAVLFPLASLGAPAYPVALFQLAAGAAFLGSVMDGLLLGHWYLTDRGLSRTPINRFATFLLVAVVVQGIAVVSGGFEPTAGSSSFNPLLTSAGLAAWISLGMVVATGMIAVLIRLTLRGPRASAVQSATGFFYLAVITAFPAELALLVRFLPEV